MPMFTGAFVIFLVLAAMISGCSSTLHPRPGYTVPPVPTAAYTETAAADFSLVDMDGQEIRLSDLYGKPVVLKFWLFDGTVDSEALPAVQRAYESCGEDIVFLSVPICGESDSPLDNAYEALRQKGYSFPIYFDRNGAAAGLYGTGGGPATVFIDRDGFIAASSHGEIDEEAFLFGLKLL